MIHSSISARRNLKSVPILKPGSSLRQSLGRDESDAVATRRRLLDPELMVPPSLWLVSEQAGDVTGTRFVAELRDSSLPPARAAEKARATAGWAVVATENLI